MSTAGFVCRGAGDEVLAGAGVIEGELHVAVTRCGAATLATAIDRTLATTAGLSGAPGLSPPPKFAERAVPPVLATAGLGLVVGDATLAAAVLRPDDATGARIGESFGLIDSLKQCWDAGVVVRQPEVFGRMAEADLVILDHDVGLEVRAVRLKDVDAVGDLSIDEILDYAACGLRQLHDERARAVRDAHAFRGRPERGNRTVYRRGGVELQDGERCIRIEGLSSTDCELVAVNGAKNGNGTPGHGTNDVRSACHPAPGRHIAPLRIYSNGRLTGRLTFCADERYAAYDSIQELRVRCGLEVELISSAGQREALWLADSLRVDDVGLCTTDESKEQLIRERRESGRRVVYVGNCRENPRAARAADVAVSHGPDPVAHDDPSDVWLLQPEYEKLAIVWEVAVAARQQSSRCQGLVVVPNVLCVAGAFLFGFTSLAAVMLSNLGTYTVYRSSHAVLRRTERRRLLRRGHSFDDAYDGAEAPGRRRLTLRGT